VPIVANVTAQAESDPETLRRLLVEQVTGSVRWRESMIWLAEQEAGDLLEVGSGKVLTGMARRIDKRLTAQALNTPDDIEGFLAQ
jgi:[acyl-carrier-protein] S-malonyltransferase